jgi:hypothetical protein
MGFPIELLLIAIGVTILVVVISRRRMLEQRLIENREKLSKLRFESTIPLEVEELIRKAPRLKGDQSFSFPAVGCFPFADNFERVRLSRRIYLVEPTEIEVMLIPEPANYERKLAVAVTIDSKVLGYVPNREAGEMHKYLLAHSTGLRAQAKIYIGSRSEFNFITLDFAKPLRLETSRTKG